MALSSVWQDKYLLKDRLWKAGSILRQMHNCLQVPPTTFHSLTAVYIPGRYQPISMPSSCHATPTQSTPQHPLSSPSLFHSHTHSLLAPLVCHEQKPGDPYEVIAALLMRKTFARCKYIMRDTFAYTIFSGVGPEGLMQEDEEEDADDDDDGEEEAAAATNGEERKV